jgi:hypothetical protein
LKSFTGGTVFEKPGVGLQSKQDLQVCEDLHKSPLHEGLQPETPVGIENIGNEADGVQNNEAAMALNQTHPHDGKDSNISASRTSRGIISGFLQVLHEVLT